MSNKRWILQIYLGFLSTVLTAVGLFAADEPMTSSSLTSLSYVLSQPATEEVPAIGKGDFAFNGIYSGGHQAALLENGQAAFEARLRMIEHAQSEVDLEYYIFEPDLTGQLILQALVKRKAEMNKAGKPFRVRILIDRLSPLLRLEKGLTLQMVASLKKSGIEVKFFHQGSMPWDLNYRNHKKSFIVDGKEFITGGRNIQNCYFGFNFTADAPKYYYYDTDIYVRGPAAAGAQGSFDAFWNSELSAVPDSTDADAKKEKEALLLFSSSPELTEKTNIVRSKGSSVLDQIRVVGSEKVVYLSDKPGKSLSNRKTEEGVMRLLNSAKKNIVIESWTFNLTMDGMDEVRSLLKRGVLFDLLTNSFRSFDSGDIFYSAQTKIDELAKLGMHVYELNGKHEPGESIRQDFPEEKRTWGTHSKVACVDGSSCFIGSANFDSRSAHLNSEEGVIILDNPKFAKQVLTDIYLRLQDAYPMTPEGRYLSTLNSVRDQIRSIKDEGPTAAEESKLHGVGHWILEQEDYFQ